MNAAKRPSNQDPKRTGEKDMSTGRKTAVWILIVIGSLLIPFMVLAFWVNNTLLTTQNYLAVVGPLSYNPTIAAAISDYTASQVIDQSKIENTVKNALPESAQSLTVPIANSVVEFVNRQIYRLVTSQAFNRLWVRINQAAHTQIVRILEGKSQALTLQNGQGTFDLGGVIDAAKARLGERGLAILEQVAPNIENRQIEVIPAPRLTMWQQYVALVEKLGYILPILIVIFWGLALWLSPIKNWVVWVMCIGVDLAMIVLSFMVIYGRSYYINQPLRPPFTSEVASTLYDAFTQPLWFVIVFLFILSLFTMWALRSYRNTHIA